VDLMACKMQSRDPWEVVPITRPSSIRCGATTIDRNFFDFMRRIIGDFDTGAAGVGVGGHYVLGPVAEALLKEFVATKHSFDREDDGLLQLPQDCLGNVLPDAWARDKVVDGELRLTREDLQEIFDPVVDTITTKLARKVTFVQNTRGRRRRTVTHIFLTGGFSENPYLYRKVQEWASLRAIDVERGDDPWSAVVRGAVLKEAAVGAALPPVAGTCPRSYGIICDQRYAEHLDHEDAEVQLNRFTGKHMARTQIFWRIHKGDMIRPGGAISRDMRIFVLFTDSDERERRELCIKFVASRSDERPSQHSELPAGEEVIRMSFNSSRIPQSQRTRLRRPGSMFSHYYRAKVTINITVTRGVKIKVTSGDVELVARETTL